MKNSYVFIGIAAMALATYAIRVLPLTLIRKEIKNKYIRSFLYYVPYVTLAVMTFPAMIYATNSLVSGLAAFIVAIILALKDFDMFKIAVASCVVVYLVELFV